MSDYIQRGLHTEGVLTGLMQIRRRAPLSRKQFEKNELNDKDPMAAVDWVNMVVFAVNEENVAGGWLPPPPMAPAASCPLYWPTTTTSFSTPMKTHSALFNHGQRHRQLV
ncbi:hypothetical protein [Eikenella exigua]|nr:hypothetical protein [Eikenella exigua]